MVDAAEAKSAFASRRIDMARFILVMVFIIEQRWSYIIEKELEQDNITTKQWLMLIVISAGFKHAPSIQEAADAMSTTHQNVKQIASGLERRGFMTLERDEKNRRIIRLKVTDKCRELFEKRAENDVKAILRMFDNLSDEDVKDLFETMALMEQRAETLYSKAKEAG